MLSKDKEVFPSIINNIAFVKMTDQGEGVPEVGVNSKEDNNVKLEENVAGPSTSDNNERKKVGKSKEQRDIIWESQPNESLPLINTYEHDRGYYVLPSVDPKIYPKDEYPKPSTEPGEVFIFNFESSCRDGTRLDVKALIESLGRLKFNIREGRIFNDLTEAEVLATIKTAVSTFDETKTPINCLIVVFLTHGHKNNILEVKDGVMAADNIIASFSKCRSLKDVPKWFTFLACKGYGHDSKEIVMENTRLPDDVIVYYSTTEGNISIRVIDEGTWVIQELCRTLCEYGRRDELFAILTRTNKAVANNYYSYQDKIGEEKDKKKENPPYRQSPVILSTLKKKFFLTLSKDRRTQLEIMNDVKNVKKMLPLSSLKQ